MEMPSTRLLQTFATCPIPVAPQWTMFLPMPASTGFTRSKSASLPPTMKVSVPAAAPPVPPDTGASTNAPPCSRTSAPNACALAGSIVLESITVAPAPSPASTPFSPDSTERTCGAAGSIVMTNVAPDAASRGDGHLRAGILQRAQGVGAQVERMYSWPAFSRFSAIGAPMAEADKTDFHVRVLRCSVQPDRRIHRAGRRVVVEPARGDRLGLRVELHDLLAVWAEIAELRAARTREAEERHGHRDRDVDADLDVDLALNLRAARRSA